MKCFKLTDRNLRTRDSFQYRLHEWTPALAGTGDLCSSGWYHAYEHPLLAALFWPMHLGLSFVGMRLFEATYDGRSWSKRDFGLKLGVVRLRLDKELQIPEISIEQRVRFAIYCALEVYVGEWTYDFWCAWAKSWLNGLDRGSAICDTAAMYANDSIVDERSYVPAACAANTAAHSARAAALARGAPKVDAVAAFNARRRAGDAADYVSKCGGDPKDADYWLGHVTRAIADEDKLQKAGQHAVQTL